MRKAIVAGTLCVALAAGAACAGCGGGGDTTEEGSGDYVELEVGDKEGFTLNEVLNEGSAYVGFEDPEQIDVDVESIIEGMYAVGTDVEPFEGYEISIYWSGGAIFSAGSSVSITLVEDVPEYSTVEVDLYIEEEVIDEEEQ